jgi:hypothetical protein
MSSSPIASVTAEILKEFTEQIDTDKEYSRKELTDILTDIYKCKYPTKKSSKKTITDPLTDDTTDDEKPKQKGRPRKVKLDKDGNVKEKRPPTAYNRFVKTRLVSLKQENPTTPSKDLMKVAGAEWSKLSVEEKAQY